MVHTERNRTGIKSPEPCEGKLVKGDMEIPCIMEKDHEGLCQFSIKGIQPKWAKRLIILLQNKPKLRNKLIEMLEIDRFFLTITMQKVRDPEHPELDLVHYYDRQKFKIDDCVPSLKHIAADFNAKQNPTAEIEGEGWH